MYVDIPEIKRCCGCVPVRFGFLLWVYLRMILCFLMLIPFVIIFSLHMSSSTGLLEFIIIALCIIALVTDIAMNIIAIIGGHSKDLKLLRIYYGYSKFALGFSIALFVFYFIVRLCNEPFLNSTKLKTWYLVASITSLGVFCVAIQVYMLLILKRNVNKLSEDCQFRFVNHAAEGECSMHIERPILFPLKTHTDDDGQRSDVLQEDIDETRKDGPEYRTECAHEGDSDLPNEKYLIE